MRFLSFVTFVLCLLLSACGDVYYKTCDESEQNGVCATFDAYSNSGCLVAKSEGRSCPAVGRTGRCSFVMDALDIYYYSNYQGSLGDSAGCSSLGGSWSSY